MPDTDFEVRRHQGRSFFAVRHELDRRRLHAFVDELVAELGPSNEAEVARYSELFAATTAVADVDREASS